MTNTHPSRKPTAMLQSLSRALPAPLRRRLPLLAQIIQFGVVGGIGFIADTAVVYALRGPTGLYVAGTLAYAVAVTITWWLNRIWTFRGAAPAAPLRQQWIRFVVVSIPGQILNLGTYFVLVTISPLCAANPVLAVFAGAVAGMFANFTLTRSLVFR